MLAQALVQQIDPKSPLRSRLWLRICGDLRMLFTNSDSSTAAGIEAMGLDLLGAHFCFVFYSQMNQEKKKIFFFRNPHTSGRRYQ